jgi:hypothetical protein
MGFHPAYVVLGKKLASGAPEFLRGLLVSVALQDAGLLLRDLSERPEGDPLAVGQGAPLPPCHHV